MSVRVDSQVQSLEIQVRKRLLGRLDRFSRIQCGKDPEGNHLVQKIELGEIIQTLRRSLHGKVAEAVRADLAEAAALRCPQGVVALREGLRRCGVQNIAGMFVIIREHLYITDKVRIRSQILQQVAVILQRAVRVLILLSHSGAGCRYVHFGPGQPAEFGEHIGECLLQRLRHVHRVSGEDIQAGTPDRLHQSGHIIEPGLLVHGPFAHRVVSLRTAGIQRPGLPLFFDQVDAVRISPVNIGHGECSLVRPSRFARCSALLKVKKGSER